jgi:hypothetical protein
VELRKFTTYLVIVPSMSEMTIKSVESQTKMRAVHATAPEADKLKVILFGPDLSSSAFYGERGTPAFSCAAP